MYEFLALLMLIGQIRGAVIMFGGHKNAPKRLRIAIGVSLILMFLVFFYI